MNFPPPPPAPVLRRVNAIGPQDFVPRNLNLDFMAAQDVPNVFNGNGLNFPNILNIPAPNVPNVPAPNVQNVQNVPAPNVPNVPAPNVPNVQNVQNAQNAINVNELNEYFYGMFQFAKNEQRARGDQTLSWDNYRNRFYNTFLVSEKENIMNDMREEIRKRYDRLYLKFAGYEFGKKSSKKSRKSKKSQKKTRKSKKSPKKTKKSKKSPKKTKKSLKKTKRV
jgi:hypothetical protein